VYVAISKMEDFLTATWHIQSLYTIKVIIYRKLCKIETSLLQTARRK